MKVRLGHRISCAALALYAITVCLLCFANLSSGPEMKQVWFGIPADKAAHFIMFFPFPILMTLALGKISWKRIKFMTFITITLVTGIVSGGLTELLQNITDYRSCDINDFRADCLGILSGTIVAVSGWFFLKNRRTKNS